MMAAHIKVAMSVQTYIVIHKTLLVSNIFFHHKNKHLARNNFTNASVYKAQ